VRVGRSLLALIWLAATIFAAGADVRPAPTVVVIASAELEAHRHAVEGIQTALAPSRTTVRILGIEQASGAARSGQLAPLSGVVVALGSEAARLVEADRLRVPAVYTMVLRRRPEWEAAGRPAPITIPLEIPLASLAARLKTLFPGRTRLGVILNPGAGGASAAQLRESAEQSGFTVQIAQCANEGQLLAALGSLRNRVDFVWCQPDGVLYNGATIQPLILASIENRLPLIGFSESFARAGAAVGIYPDFREVGVQAGEAARQLLEGQIPRPVDGPRRLKVAVNASVLRLFGLRNAATTGDDVTVLP